MRTIEIFLIDLELLFKQFSYSLETIANHLHFFTATTFIYVNPLSLRYDSVTYVRRMLNYENGDNSSSIVDEKFFKLSI